MYKIFFLIGMIAFSYGIFDAFAQEPQLATFQETAQILIDQPMSKNVTASISLQSTSNQEIRIPSELEQKIRENDRILAIVLTNAKQCVLGVQDQACIMVNVSRDESEEGIIEVQEGAKAIGNSIIDDINAVFDTNAQFHSAYVHHKDEVNVALETSGVISGRGTVSAVYTLPLEKTNSMYDKLTAILIPGIIRDSGGFYEIAKRLSNEPNSSMTISIIPRQNGVLYQIKVAVDYPNAADIDVICPLEFLKTNTLQRSDYYSRGFYPLNSILNVVVLSSESTHVNEVGGNFLPIRIVDGEKIPQVLTIKGWVFDPENGTKIDGKYLFGVEPSVEKNELVFTLGSATIGPYSCDEPPKFDESIIIVIIIVIAAAGAAAFFFKGFKK